MQWQGPGQNSGEVAIGRYFLSGNTEMVAAKGANLISGNLKGLMVFLELTPANIVKGFGIDVRLNQSAIDAEHLVPIGVIVSDHIVDRDPIVNIWVDVQTYGPCNRICIDSDASSTSLMTLWTTTTGQGCIGFARSSLKLQRKFLGVATIDTNGASASLDLSGANTATVTWGGGGPGTNPTPVGDTNSNDMAFVGYTPLEAAPTAPADLLAGALVTVAGARRGYIMCLSQNYGRY